MAVMFILSLLNFITESLPVILLHPFGRKFRGEDFGSEDTVTIGVIVGFILFLIMQFLPATVCTRSDRIIRAFLVTANN